MPYSCTATRPPGASRSVSTVASTSRQVKGSGTGAAPVTFNSRSAASGFGPRATIRVRARRAVKSGQTSATAAASARVPTPVSRMTTSTSPASRRRASSRAAGLRGSDASRSAGARMTVAPCRSSSVVSSSARRVSKMTMRTPPRASSGGGMAPRCGRTLRRVKRRNLTAGQRTSRRRIIHG